MPVAVTVTDTALVAASLSIAVTVTDPPPSATVLLAAFVDKVRVDGGVAVWVTVAVTVPTVVIE